MRIIKRLSVIAISIICLCLSVSAQKTAPTDVLLTVGGKVEHPLSLTRADLEKFTRQTMKIKSRDGKERKYEGVSVGDILLKVGVEFGEALHQEAAATYLLAEATDGYRVVFALPEFDSPSIDRLILLADRIDGNPIPAATGPLQLIVPGDKGRGRWVRQLKSLTLVLAPSTSR